MAYSWPASGPVVFFTRNTYGVVKAGRERSSVAWFKSRERVWGPGWSVLASAQGELVAVVTASKMKGEDINVHP